MLALVVKAAERCMGLALASRDEGKLVGGEAFVTFRRARQGRGPAQIVWRPRRGC